MTRDFAMVVYSNEGASLGSNSTTTVPMFASTSASFRGTWHTKCLPRTNHGPQQCSPPHEQPIPPSQSGGTGSATNEFNQCVFVRYYTICSRKRWAIFSQTVLMRAGAGPHDLGSGDNGGDVYPELTVKHGAEPTTSSDEDLSSDDAVDDGTDSEPDIVVRNTPYEEEHNSWYAIADYVFQVIPFPALPPGHSTVSMEELQRYIRFDAPSRSGGDSCGCRYGRHLIYIGHEGTTYRGGGRWSGKDRLQRK
ncbi:hypothetical protein BDM02DRAFT_2478209 [Thelephora ganbajun]|uniref:Uncharacterized protein n=1 Tax=Thelephora ganbajun TaxID=370292 RepID=A0ACB6ZEJ5_THEGA|nr:hypothetical protein BDM02DRAFT_2478209 [Thelephora ganbajun]